MPETIRCVLEFESPILAAGELVAIEVPTDVSGRRRVQLQIESNAGCGRHVIPCKISENNSADAVDTFFVVVIKDPQE